MRGLSKVGENKMPKQFYALLFALISTFVYSSVIAYNSLYHVSDFVFVAVALEWVFSIIVFGIVMVFCK